MSATMAEIMGRWETRATDPAWQAEQEALEARRKADMAKDLRIAKREMLEKLDLPTRPLEVVGDGVKPTAALAAVEDVKGLLVLAGAPGCGKTLAAVEWLCRLVQDDANWSQDGINTKFNFRRPVFVTAAKLSRWPRYDESAMDRLLRASRLVVDDMGVEYLDQNGAYASLLDELVNERHTLKATTVFTTNLTAEQFKTRYGERIADRIREAGAFVSVADKSMRKRT